MDNDKLNAVRRAKKRFAEIVPKDVEVAGIGIAMTQGDPALKVNLRKQPSNPDALPRTVDGVPVIYDVVGTIVPR
ncbi:hypothetical protein [Pseudorhodoplanes sp.]|uniref:hypothetical protein n=1 Tax=Pseudorhodoplanes sp. TaxID=1934341 RepID=UPI00391AB47E